MKDSATMTATTDQWMQFYHHQQQQQPLMDLQSPQQIDLGFSDSTVMTTSPTPTNPASESILSPTNTSYNGQLNLTPKGNVSKPIRRRSRASKRTPTTLLNANTTNFRALVQQFTGCPSTTMASLGVHKGPITLNFQQGTEQRNHNSTSSRIITPTFSYNNQISWQKKQEQVNQQNLFQEQQLQQSGYSFDYVKSSDFVPNSGNSSILPSSTSMEVSSDGLLVDDDFSLNDLTVNAFNNDSF